MLFSERLTEQEEIEAKSSGREEMLDLLLCDFRAAFPDLTFELQLDAKIINAQAVRLGGKRIVTVYGGLAHHPRLGLESLTFILLHETGHHLAEGCRSRNDPSLACECRADHWATTTGAEKLELKSGRCLQLLVAIRELDEIMPARQNSGRKYSERVTTKSCWAKGWTSRSRALLEQVLPPTTKGCCISYI
jgi:hypothetical protein